MKQILGFPKLSALSCKRIDRTEPENCQGESGAKYCSNNQRGARSTEVLGSIRCSFEHTHGEKDVHHPDDVYEQPVHCNPEARLLLRLVRCAPQLAVTYPRGSESRLERLVDGVRPVVGDLSDFQLVLQSVGELFGDKDGVVSGAIEAMVHNSLDLAASGVE